MQIELMGLGNALVNNIPAYIVWIFGIVMAVIMLRRGGKGGVKLLLAGCILMFVSALVSPFIRTIINAWLVADDIRIAARTMSLVNIPVTIVSTAGIICLVIAFWKQFWRKKGASV